MLRRLSRITFIRDIPSEAPHPFPSMSGKERLEAMIDETSFMGKKGAAGWLP